MVYMGRDGQVLESRPWGLNSLTDLFWGFINFVTIFFTTLINPNATAKGDGYTTDYRNTGWFTVNRLPLKGSLDTDGHNLPINIKQLLFSTENLIKVHLTNTGRGQAKAVLASTFATQYDETLHDYNP